MRTKIHTGLCLLSAKHWQTWISRTFIPTLKAAPCGSRLRNSQACLQNTYWQAQARTELLDLLMRVFLEPNDCILSCPPTFGMYPFDAELNAARCIEVPRHADFSLDMDPFAKQWKLIKPKLFFITSPNNPDGSVLDAKTIDALLDCPL